MSDHVKILREYNIWRRGEREDMKMPAPDVIGQSIDAAIAEIFRLRKIEKAAHVVVHACGQSSFTAAIGALNKLAKVVQ